MPAWAQGTKVLNVALFPEPNALMIGAGSTVFTRNLLGDMLSHRINFAQFLITLEANGEGKGNEARDEGTHVLFVGPVGEARVAPRVELPVRRPQPPVGVREEGRPAVARPR